MDLSDNSGVPAFKEVAAQADSFCAYGAIIKSMAAHNELTADIIETKLWQSRDGGLFERVLVPVDELGYRGTIIDVNDSAPNFEPVREMFCSGIKRAIEEEEEATDAKVE